MNTKEQEVIHQSLYHSIDDDISTTTSKALTKTNTTITNLSEFRNLNLFGYATSTIITTVIISTTTTTTDLHQSNTEISIFNSVCWIFLV
ncbi:hypothetical protein LOAG_12343 [Loa loa]|uniref:Uncharacterized protein n=1 Tax=Loa loa TaxID=7209 RepID=A0A1S0TLC6_LOALO|nr:hypothetical protein LOAG_12343 [Loa loa]EFO16164.1 hypothetical protein LOAG_12343 [Loa loa]